MHQFGWLIANDGNPAGWCSGVGGVGVTQWIPHGGLETTNAIVIPVGRYLSYIRWQTVRMKTPTTKRPEASPTCTWPSHHPFRDLIHFCVRGTSNPALQTCLADDHVAELCDLLHDDIDSFLWVGSGPGKALRDIMSGLEARVQRQGDVAAARLLYALATQAAFEVMRLYLRHPEVFEQIAPERTLLPLLHSIHPGTAKVAAQMQAAARLGVRTRYARQIGSKAFFQSDAPANVYARAIITCIEMNEELKPISCQQYFWDQFDRQEGTKTLVLPFPKYVRDLKEFPSPITPENVMRYWQKGKEIILEELPDFHLRPEWKSYQLRKYAGGAKKGVIQHAIFKDILVALQTIAGKNKRRIVSQAAELREN